MAGVMAEGRSCRVVAFLRQFYSVLRGRGTGFFELAKSEKSGGVEFCRYAPQVARGATASPV